MSLVMSTVDQIDRSSGLAHRTACRRALCIPPRFDCVQGAIAGLEELEAGFMASEDRRSIFATTYLLTTRTIQACIRRGYFVKTAAVIDCVVSFANFYRQALVDYEAETRDAVPKAWRQSFASCAANRASILQDMLLAINAHLNHDLPLAVMESEFNVHCDHSYADFIRLNEAMRLATPIIRQRIALLYPRSLRVTNWVLGPAIDKAVTSVFRRTRQNSWNLARILALAGSFAETVRIRRMIDDRAALAGEMILAKRYIPNKSLAALYEIENFVPCPTPIHLRRKFSGTSWSGAAVN